MKENLFNHCLVFWPALSRRPLSWRFPDGRFSLQLGIVQKAPCCVSCYDSDGKHLTLMSIIVQVTASVFAIVTLVLRQDMWNNLLDNTRYVEVIRQNVLSSMMANHCCCRCCCCFIYRLGAVGMLQRCSFFDLEFISDCSWPIAMLIIFKIVFPLCKIFCHLNAALRHKASSPYAFLIIWNVSLAGSLFFSSIWRFLVVLTAIL